MRVDDRRVAPRRTDPVSFTWILLCVLAISGCNPAASPRPGDPQGLATPSNADIQRIARTADEAEVVPGIRLPETLAASEFQLEPTAWVIGVDVGSSQRAYLLSALTGAVPSVELADRMHEREKRVVNDLVGGVPVSVTFCDENHTVRVLTSLQSEPLELGVVGWSDHQLVLETPFRRFQQLSPSVPFEDLPFELCRWGEWQTRYPTTDIYVGGLDE